MKRQIAQNGLHVRDVVHVCAGGSGGVPLVAGAGGVRGVGPSRVGVGSGHFSHVGVENRWGGGACPGVEIGGVEV